MNKQLAASTKHFLTADMANSHTSHNLFIKMSYQQRGTVLLKLLFNYPSSYPHYSGWGLRQGDSESMEDLETFLKKMHINKNNNNKKINKNKLKLIKLDFMTVSYCFLKIGKKARY